MKVHYFQRYHDKENVATANTMLLLSRLYSYSPNIFYEFLKQEFLELYGDRFEPEIRIDMQVKSKQSVPDAIISQEGYQIVVETKTSDWFTEDQLSRHLEAFGENKFKVLVTIASEKMDPTKKEKVDEQIEKYNGEKYNGTKMHPINHINTTFDNLINSIQDMLTDKDYEMQDVLDDYLDFCYTSNLIPEVDSWKYMRVVPVGKTIDFNKENSIYYDKAKNGFRPHDYIGLYKDKRVQAIGKVVARITAIQEDGSLQFEAEFGEVTEERKKQIELAIEDAVTYGYDLESEKHMYFFVKTFHETKFEKTSKNGLRGKKYFNLKNYIKLNKDTPTDEIAEKLMGLEWE